MLSGPSRYDRASLQSLWRRVEAGDPSSREFGRVDKPAPLAPCTRDRRPANDVRDVSIPDMDGSDELRGPLSASLEQISRGESIRLWI